jgi:formylglycine-generating enzyme required for sulfatase activity
MQEKAVQHSLEIAGQDTKRLPVEMVLWGDAREFCSRLSEMPEEKSAGRRAERRS